MEEIKKYEPKSDNNRVFSDYNKKKTIIKGELKPEHDDDKNMTEKTNVKHKKIEKKETMTLPQKKPMKMQVILQKGFLVKRRENWTIYNSF